MFDVLMRKSKGAGVEFENRLTPPFLINLMPTDKKATNGFYFQIRWSFFNPLDICLIV
jgi:hypothetical protein